MKEISKELLSLVLGEEVNHVFSDDAKLDYRVSRIKNHVHYLNGADNTHSTNLDTLGRLYKEWAYKEFKITIQSAVSGTGGFAFSPTYLSYPGLDTETVFTEVESIIDVTEHIAKEKGLL